MNLTKFSIYAILHVDKLKDAYQAGGIGQFEEDTKWKTGAELFRNAQKSGRCMPILFADAATTGNLLYYGFLTDVKVIGEKQTRYSFEDLTPITGEIPKSKLIRRNGNTPLSDAYQRSYSIVYTPNFIRNS